MGLAKREVAREPVLITDRGGQPTHVLMPSIAEYRRLTGEAENMSTCWPVPDPLNWTPTTPPTAPGNTGSRCVDVPVRHRHRAGAAQGLVAGRRPGLAAWAAGIKCQRLFWVGAQPAGRSRLPPPRLARKDNRRKAAGLAVRDWIDNQVTPPSKAACWPWMRAGAPPRPTAVANRRRLVAATALEHGLTFCHPLRHGLPRRARVGVAQPSGFAAMR